MAATDPTKPRRFWSLALAAGMATFVAVYLLIVALRQKGLPVGCGEQGGCAEVLSSRWSTIAGLPVSALAIPVYATIFFLALRPSGRVAIGFFRFASVLLVLAALWFVGLQAFVLRAYCPWCLGEHLLGIVVAAMSARAATVLAADQSRLGGNLPSWSAAGAPAVMGMAVLILGQVIVAPPATTVRLEPDLAHGDATDGSEPPASARASLSLLSGHLLLDPAVEPRIGAEAATHTVYLMFDYCCPHCRRTHEYLQKILADRPNEMAIVALPMPRDADCNPALTSTEARFEHACELAELALSVWRADPSAFAAFDRWLFAQDQPPTPADALQQAERLVDADALAAARASRYAADTIKRNVTAYNQSDAEYLPVVLAPGMAPIVGRPESESALREMLERDLFSAKSP